MTDKTPKKTAENPMNIPRTMDATRGSEPKSRALPQADALKVRFKAGSIPLQTDFADLIDLANMGRQAVGGAEGQTGPANGFALSSEGRLELKPNAAKGISVDQDGVAIKLKTISGLTMNEDGIAVKPKANSGIELKDSAGISIKPGDGIQINMRGVSIKLATNSGLSADQTNGLKIVPEQMFQKGMVMMFAGTEAEMPKGWALCDGNAGRPDLRDRFVLGATGFNNVNTNNNKKVTGDNINKEFLAKTDNATPKINATVNGHVLSTDQIPEHNHLGGMRSSCYSAHNVEVTAEYGSKLATNKSPDNGYPLADIETLNESHSFFGTQLYTSKTGGTKSHDHKASATQDAHNHSINVVPPYYILAFIIKL